MNKVFFFLIFSIVACASGFAQFNNDVFVIKRDIQEADTNKLFLQIENSNLIKNNEYFSNLIDGHTIIGYYLQPRLVYLPAKKVRIDCGLHVLKYSGLDEFSRILPVFSVRATIFRDVDLVMGTINGSLYHKLIEPVYEFDRYFEEDIESGVQLLIDKRFVEVDLWINWEKFIFRNDPYREEFSTGLSMKLKLTNPQSKHIVTIPFQGLAYHIGGQIDASSVPIQTYMNTATGLEYEYSFNRKIVKSVGTKNYYLTYDDYSKKKIVKYSAGQALYSTVSLNTSFVNLMMGYWYAEKYIAPKGEVMFQCMSTKWALYLPKRHLITAKIDLHKSISKGVELGARFESYIDTDDKQMDYSYGMYLLFNSEYFLTSITRRAR